MDRKTRRGDLAIIELTRISHGVSGRTEDTGYAVMLVSSVTREGVAKAVRDVRWGDDAYVQPLHRMFGVQRVLIIPQDKINVTDAIATARAHVYPGSTTPMDYASLEDVRSALRPHAES